MDWIVVEGAGYDGRYEFDLDSAGFTTLEWGWIKRLAGYMPLTIDEGWRGGDAELFTVFAVIAIVRAGKARDTEAADVFGRLQRAPFDTLVRFETDTANAEDDAGPPATSSSSNGGSSGAGSPTSSERSGRAPTASGTPVSATSGSGPPTSPG